MSRVGHSTALVLCRMNYSIFGSPDAGISRAVISFSRTQREPPG